MRMKKRESRTYSVSPLLVMQSHEEGRPILNLVNQLSIESMYGDIYDVLWFYLEPHTVEDGIRQRLNVQAIRACIKEKLLLNTRTRKYASARLWEDRYWTRAAYITFSQMNLRYNDELEAGTAQHEWILKRREVIRSYLAAGAYPKKFQPKLKVSYRLHTRFPVRPHDLDSMLHRHSLRAFSETNVRLHDFEEILYAATRNARLAKRSQDGKDPFFKFNSYYSWLTLYVYVQGIEQISAGLYYYDYERSELRLVTHHIDDRIMSKTIQNQNWILGGGFCVLIGVQWERYMWTYRHSRAYMNLLIQIGELSQEFVRAASAQGLGGWMTPATTERKMAQLCKFDGDVVDIMHFMKFGYPRSYGRDGHLRHKK